MKFILLLCLVALAFASESDEDYHRHHSLKPHHSHHHSHHHHSHHHSHHHHSHHRHSHHHHSHHHDNEAEELDATTAPSTSTKSPRKCGCFCQYMRCRFQKHEPTGKKACGVKFVQCIKKICDTKVCDAYEIKCAKKPHASKRRCKWGWLICVRKMSHKICHKQKKSFASDLFGNGDQNKRRRSTTTDASSTPTRKPTQCTCKCKYMKCLDHTKTHKGRDKCIVKVVKCIKKKCNTKKCDVWGKKCMKKAGKDDRAKHRCARGWFSCVRRMRKQICHEPVY